MSEIPSVHPARSIYRLQSAVGLVVAGLFGWNITVSFAWGSLFFFVAALAFAGVNARWAWSSVELTPTGITYHRVGVGPLHVDFRQMAAISEAGRLTPGLSLVFFPLDDEGLVDMDRPRSLFLPAVERQDELLQVLLRRIPG